MLSPGGLRRSRGGSIRGAALYGVIALLASAALAAGSRAQAPAPALRLPADAVFDSTVGADSAVVFRHGTHVSLASDRCTGCHPKLFRILAPTRRITHAQMNAGLACGACHDGEHAFGVKAPESCPACHAGRRSAATAVEAAPKGGEPTGTFRGPRPIRYKSSEVSPGPVTFDHATHVKGGCGECHPRLFAMKSSAAAPRSGMHEANACGACHDGKRSFGVEDERACFRCHREGAR